MRCALRMTRFHILLIATSSSLHSLLSVIVIFSLLDVFDVLFIVSNDLSSRKFENIYIYYAKINGLG